MRWVRLALHATWDAAVRQRDEPRDRRTVGPRLLLLVPAQTWGEPPRGRADTPTDSRPGTPAVNARLHLTPNPRSAPGTIRTVRLAHHVSHYADLAESRLIEHPKASKTLRRSAVNHRGGPLSPTGVTATQMLD